jgi:hypothetical protein
MLIKNSVAVETYIPQKVAGLFVADSLNAGIGGKKVTSTVGVVTKLTQLIAESEAAFPFEVSARMNNIPGAGARVAVRANERFGEASVGSRHEVRADSFNGVEAHPSAGTGREDAEDEFFEEARVVAVATQVSELS